MIGGMELSTREVDIKLGSLCLEAEGEENCRENMVVSLVNVAASVGERCSCCC